jgi:hypothetical protein
MLTDYMQGHIVDVHALTFAHNPLACSSQQPAVSTSNQ